MIFCEAQLCTALVQYCAAQLTKNVTGEGHLFSSLIAAGQQKCMANLQELCMLDDDDVR